MTDAELDAAVQLWHDKVACLKRELAMRQRVYPRRVADGQMKQAEADHQLAVMAAILDDYTCWLKGHPGGIDHARQVAAGTAPATGPEHQAALL